MIALAYHAGYNEQYFVSGVLNKHKLLKEIIAAVNNHRPKNLNLLTIRFPIPAIVSILHRITGVLMFLLLPALLWVLHKSLISQQDFDEIRQIFSYFTVKFVVWGFLAAFIYHLVAGVRHLLMDIHIGEELKSGRIGAMLVIVVSVLFIILAGVWLW